MNARRYDGAQLRELRQAAGIRMVDLARAVGCHYCHLAPFEWGKRHISPVLAHRIARALTDLSGTTVTVDDFSTLGDQAEDAA